MKKIFNNVTKYLLLIVMIISDLMSPIKVLADTTTPSNADEAVSSVRIGIDKNQNYFDVDDRELDTNGNPVLNEGDLVVTKSVEEEDVLNGKYRVNFSITGKETTESVLHPLYSVIVLDTSDSMNNQKMKDAQNALKNYSHTLANGVNQFALVLFDENSGSNYYNKGRWHFGTSEIGESELPGIGNTHPGTRYMKGLTEAKRIIDNASIPEDAKVIIVFISDGSPHDATYLFNQAIPNNIGTTDELMPKQALTDIKNAVDEIYTIGYDLEHEANPNRSEAILRNVSTDLMNNYMAADNGSLASTIQTLANELNTSPAATDLSITEVTSSNFKLSLGELATKDIELDGNNISFDIEIKNKNTATGVYPTNDTDNTVLTYTGVDGQEHIVAINKTPTVNWVKQNYTINYYKDEVNDNNYLGTSGLINALDGTTVTLTDEQKNAFLSTELISNGYELSGSNNYSIIIDANADNVINVLYEKKKLNYILEYFFENNNTYTENTNLRVDTNTCKYGDGINALDKVLTNVPEGYILDETKTKEVNNGIYTITENNTEIKIYYKKQEFVYNYKYLFEASNGSYAEDSNYPGNNNGAKYGDEISYTNHTLNTVPAGFELNTGVTEGTNNGTYTITDNNTIINIYYSRISLTYDVKYLFENLNGNYVELDNISGINDISAKYGYEVNYSNHILTSVPEGYVLDDVKSTEINNGNYVIVNNDTVVKVYYKRSKYSFTVNYHFNSEFDNIYSYSNDAIYGSTLNASDYKLETVNNDYLNNKKTNDNEDYFLDPTNSSNFCSITVGTTDNSMNLFYISTFFKDNSEEITKSSNTDKVTTTDQVIDYSITYKNTINNVRKDDVITITVVDNLPFEIDPDNSNLVSNGVEGVYDNSNKTITWTFAEIASEFNNVYNVEKNISFTVVYKDFADISSTNNNKLINTASGMTTINNTSTDGSTSDTEEIPVEIYGKVLVNYVDDKGNILDSYTLAGLAGSVYETEVEDFEGYILNSAPENAKDIYVANTTIYVEYVYTKNVGTYEELPPQTGVEDTNLNYIKYLLVALLLLLFDKKNNKVKNN